MIRFGCWRNLGAALMTVLVVTALSGCGALRDFRGANSLPLPGTAGGDPGSFTIQAQMPDVQNLKQNSKVLVNDVTVGNVTKIERQGWHALVTMTVDGSVRLPANATATLGQSSLLGSLHIQLASPKSVEPQGTLHNGSVIPLASTGAYPSTEQTLGALGMLLNGGGIGQIQDITTALTTAFSGREQDTRSLIEQLDKFTAYLNDQENDIISATDSLNRVAGQFASQEPVINKALQTIPNALAVLKDDRQNLVDALDQAGKFSALAADSVNKTKESLLKELGDLGPVLQSLADAGPALTRSLDFYATFPFPKPTLSKWMRGEYGNLTVVLDLTLSRLDGSFFVGTRWEGQLTELELQWGRTIGQVPSPYTARNPLIAPYHFDQGP